MIRVPIIKVVLVGVRAAYALETIVLRVGNLHINLISPRVSLVSPFIPYFILLMEASLVSVTLLARVVVSLREVHLMGILAEVVTLGQPNLLSSVQRLRPIMIVGPSTISLERVPIVGVVTPAAQSV